MGVEPRIDEERTVEGSETLLPQLTRFSPLSLDHRGRRGYLGFLKGPFFAYFSKQKPKTQKSLFEKKNNLTLSLSLPLS